MASEHDAFLNEVAEVRTEDEAYAHRGETIRDALMDSVAIRPSLTNVNLLIVI